MRPASAAGALDPGDGIGRARRAAPLAVAAGASRSIAASSARRGRRGPAWPATARRAALGPPQFVDETGDAPGSPTTYDGRSDFASAAASPSFDCDGDGRPDLYVAGGANPAALYRNDEPGRRRAAVRRASPRPGAPTSTGRCIGAYPIDIDGDGIVDLVVLRTAGTCSCAASAAAGSSGANEALGARRRHRLDDRVQRDLGGHRPALPTLASATT